MDNVETFEESIFGLKIPKEIAGVPSEILNARNTWEDKQKYDAALTKLANMFIENFKKFEANSSDNIRSAGPKI